MKEGTEAKVVQREQEQAGTIPGSKSTGKDGEHRGVRLLNLNKQPGLQVARLHLRPSQPKHWVQAVSPLLTQAWV